jgi:NAD(P)-dependent dehydrogenase (short-subunit alcohol dehydrogenase family)
VPPYTSELLRAGLLEGVGVLLIGPPDPSPAIREACEALGARVSVCAADAETWADEAAMDQLVERALARQPDVQLLVVDGAGLFVAAANAGRDALAACLEGSWNATRAGVNRALLARGGERRLVLLAPAASAGEHARAARAGLENLARTLSVEWARHGLTAVALAAGEQTPAGELAALVAYVASPAGAYLSGTLLAPR